MLSRGPSLASLLLFALACQPDRVAGEAGAAPPAPKGAEGAAPPKLGAQQRYGGPITGDGPTLPLASVLAQPERYSEQTVTVEGTVRRACTRKGCWMELSTAAEDAAPGCRVTFKDYGFFVPTDSAGSRARVQGQLKLQTVSKETVRHHEGEGAVYPSKRADGSATELRLVATGVELTKG